MIALISGSNGTRNRRESFSTAHTSSCRVTTTSRPMRATGQTRRITAKANSMNRVAKRRLTRRSMVSMPSTAMLKGGGRFGSFVVASASS